MHRKLPARLYWLSCELSHLPIPLTRSVWSRQIIPGFIKDNAGLAAIHNGPAPSATTPTPPQPRQHSANAVAAALAESLGKPLPWAVGFFFGNPEISVELWTVIAGISGFDHS